MSFKDKVVIVTGASSGIGAAAAVLFSKECATVTLIGRNEVKLKNVAQQCANVGPTPLIIKADVSVDGDAKRVVSETVKKFGKIDVLVNNAGMLSFGNILSGGMLESYDKIVGVNLRAVIHLTTLVAPHLVKTKGNIVNISSIAGQRISSSAFLAYCTTKAGVDHFTRGSASELAPSGVRVNAISPGPVATEIIENTGSSRYVMTDVKTALGRISQPEEIADLIIFLASDKARGITGSVFVTDNGRMLLTSSIVIQ